MAFSDFLKVWLTFNNDATTDNKGNSWTAYNNPTVSADNAISDNALQLDGKSYLKLPNVTLGGKDFTIDCWFSATTNTTGGAVCIWQLYIGDSNRFHISISTSGILSLWKDSDNTLWIQTTQSVLDGNRHHVAAVYHNSTWFLFLDGVLVGSKTHSFSAKTYTLYVGTNYATGRRFTGSIDEFRIYDGVALWTENFTPPSAADYLHNFSFVVDAERKIKNAPLTWRYENAGTADLLTVSGTTLTDLPVTQSKTGSAFYQTARAKCFDIPATKEIWAKFDVYTTLAKRWRAYNNNALGVCSYTDGTFAYWSSNSTVVKELSGKVKNQLQTVLLHMISDSSEGVIEAWLDGEKLYTYTGNVNNGEDFADIFLQSDGAGTFFSNVIISNAEIALDENVDSSIHFDTTFDAQRLVGNTVTIDFDAQRIISPPVVHFDTTFDAQRLVHRSVILDADAQRIVKKTFTVDFDAERIITTAPATLAYLSFDELEPDTGQEFNYYADPYYDEYGRNWYNPRSSSYVTKTNAKFGNALTMDGNGYLNHDGSFSLGSQDFTVDGWAFIDSDCADCSIAILEISYSNDYSLRFKDGKFVFSHSNEDLTADFAIVNHWFYFAISYQHSTGTITLFVNGVDVAHFDAQIDYGDTFSVTFGDGLLGLLDELRVIDGRALWYNPEHFDLSFDAEISFSNNHNFVTIDFDSCRNVHRTVNFLVDTCRNISHKFIMTPAKDGILYAYAEESTGIQSLQIDIAPQQITDQFSFATVNNVDILQNVKGQYLDYLFDLRIEKITQKGILNTCLCCSDVDKILYTQLAYKVKGTTGGRYIITLENQVIVSEMPKASAHSHISRIADILGKKLVYLADEFISSIDTEQGGVTYNDLIRDIFGWSSRVPTKLINVYIRNDSLYVVQRGHEQNTIDISDKLIANLTITKELYRTTWGSTPTSYTVTQTTGKKYGMEPILRPWQDEDTPPEPSTPSRVLPSRIEHSENGVTTYTYYEYDDDGNVTMVTNITADSKTVTYNYYQKIHGRKYLVREVTETYESPDGGAVIDTKYVYHDYLTQGQENIMGVDGEGNIDGSITTPSRIDARPTPFEDTKNSEHYYNYNEDNRTYTYVDGVKMEIIGYRNVTYDNEKEITNNGIALYDSSFPIEDYNTLYALTAELRRLNRTIQESISLDIYDFPHVFDFNDKIIFGGNEYFLDSNSVSKTPRIVNKQSLKLVRWY